MRLIEENVYKLNLIKPNEYGLYSFRIEDLEKINQSHNMLKQLYTDFYEMINKHKIQYTIQKILSNTNIKNKLPVTIKIKNKYKNRKYLYSFTFKNYNDLLELENMYLE